MPLRWWLAIAAAVLGGVALDSGSPWLAWWPGGFLGVGLILLALWQQRVGFAVLIGAIAGAAFWLPHIDWLTLYLGPVPWLALCAVMIAWFAVFGAATAIATRGFAMLRTPWLRILCQAVTVTALWVAREQLQSSWPYGGFAWGRVAYTQLDGPFVSLASWFGFAGFSACVVGGVALLIACVAEVTQRGSAGRGWRNHTAAFVLASCSVVVLLVLAWVPPAMLESRGTVRVAAVQGNSKSGIFDDRENGDVFSAHLNATRAFLADSGSTARSVDLLVWPENSAEYQLPAEPTRLAALRQLAREFTAPIVVGTILSEEETSGERRFTNSSLLISEDAAVGVTVARYDKRRPVPFAEYMPNRAFFRALAPELVDLVQLEYEFGSRSAVLPVDTEHGVLRAGVAICFDIVFDDQARAMMQDDAEFILAQTNNADFGRTNESAQQLAIARLRAVETGRAVVNISTVGTSAVALPDGTLAAELTPFTAATMVADIPRVSGQTPALRFGGVIAAAWLCIAVCGFGLASALSYLGRGRRA